jgi:hypothetical protein
VSKFFDAQFDFSGFEQIGGLRKIPTPSGVLVVITSPGWSVIPSEPVQRISNQGTNRKSALDPLPSAKNPTQCQTESNSAAG